MNKILMSGLFIYSSLMMSTTCLAQVTPDNTLNTTVENISTSTGILSKISGGTSKGRNLFHSLQRLDINKGDIVDLLNSNDFKRIFIRVTGGKNSTIDGKINSDSNASIFLINKTGFSINKNAAFNVGGSLILTTSSKIGFFDGKTFGSVGKTNEYKDLSSEEINILSFEGDSGKILISGNGHTINQIQSYPSTPFTAGVIDQKGFISSGGSITLAGSDINLNGGIISNSTGNINFISVKKGDVYLNNLENLSLSKDAVLLDLYLDNRSLVYTKGNGNGSINISGNDIDIQNRSLIIAGNYGSFDGGDINIGASGTLSLNEPDNTFNRSLIWSENASEKIGSNIHIDADNIKLKNSVGIASLNYGNGIGGTIYINSKENIEGASDNLESPEFVNPFITSTNLSQGKSGNTIVSSKNISLTNNSIIGNFCYGIGGCGDVKVNANFIGFYDGGLISSITFGPGNSGSIDINTDIMYIYGFRKIDFSNSGVISSSFSSGNAGQINVNTNYLTILDGGVLSASALSSGDGGDISVRASKEIVISGVAQGSRNPTQIAAFSSFLDPVTASYYNLYATPSGRAGSINIDTESLKILNGGRITVQSDGLGLGGTVNVNASKVLLDNGKINASTDQSDGGNLVINAGTAVVKNKSTISASAGNNGDGGNVSLDTKAFAADQSSKVLAQAIFGNGGDISIASNGFIGRPIIDASSQLGISGTVTIRGETLKRTDSLMKEDKAELSKLVSKCIPGSKFGKIIAVTDDFLSEEILDNLRARPEQLKFVDDLDGGKIKPLLPERGYVSRSDGKIDFVYAVPSDVVLSSKIYKNGCKLLDSTSQSLIELN